MSLLGRIAVSNGSPTRKAQATLYLAAMQRGVVERWNRDMEREIQAKVLQAGYASSAWGSPRIEGAVGLKEEQGQVH